MADRKKVLIVEDEKSLEMALYMELDKQGYMPSFCIDGQQAIDLLGKEKFDLVLLDLVLPVKDGYQVLTEKVNTINKDTPVIVLTNLTAAASLERAKQLGARDCFMKSHMSLKVVMTLVKSILGYE